MKVKFTDNKQLVKILAGVRGETLSPSELTEFFNPQDEFLVRRGIRRLVNSYQAEYTNEWRLKLCDQNEPIHYYGKDDVG
jgi:hypothetical protein